MIRNMVVALCALIWVQPAHAFVDIDTHELSSGAELWVAEENAIPVVSMRIRFDGGGSASDPHGKEGRAVIAARMLGEGAGTRDALAFKQALAEKAIELSISAGDDDLHVQLRCLRTHVPDALKLLADALARPRFDADAFARVKRQHVATIESLKQRAGYQATRALDQVLFDGHPYASDGMGTEATMEALSIDDMHAYQQSVISAARSGVVIAGALSMRDARGLFRAFYADLPEKTLDYTPTPEARLNYAEAPIRVALPLPQSAIRISLPWVSRDDPDFYAAYVLHTIIGGGSALNSMLGEELRREAGLVYDVRTQLDLREAASLLVVSAATRNDQALDAIARIKEVFANVQQHGVGQKRCEEAKQYIIGRLPLMVDSTRGLVGMMGMMQREDLGDAYLEDRTQLFQSVSCEQINAFAAEHLSPEQFSIAIAGGDTVGDAAGSR